MARVLVVGNGGREHALCWALARSPQVEKIYTNKSNPGAQALAKFGGVLGGGGDFSALARAAKENGITLAVIGPEAPLADGIVDAFAARGLVALGPRRQAARLESSKSYAKKIMARARIPTAAWFLARDIGEAKRALRKLEHPAVVKADGLAAGKGVVVCDDIESAERAAIEMLGGRFGEASRAVVIEERLSGREASVIALADGGNVALLPSAQDYKRLLPGDEGPNTGGMGAISPARADSETLAERVLERAILPALAAIEEETGAPYRGFLFAGVMARENGDFRVLEFNCRLGDPEAQAVLPRLQGDFFAALDACANGNSFALEWRRDRQSAAVTLAARGYPDAPQSGDRIENLEALYPAADAADGMAPFAFVAAARRDESGALFTAGGRVASVVALAASSDEAARAAQQAAAKIEFEGKQIRADIGV